MEITLGELAKRLNAEIKGEGSATINSIGPLASADKNTLSFLTDDKHRSELKDTQAGAMLVDKFIDGVSIAQLAVKNVNAALIESLKIFAPKLEPAPPGIDVTAKIGKQANIGKNVSIGPFVVVENRAQIGDDSVISAGCKIGQNTKIGNNCRFDGNVVIYHNCVIGNNVLIQANSTVGSTGFGYSFIDGAHRLIPHNGNVVIEDFVEIGANCCVDRAKFGETRIGAGTKIDNLVQIAHNVIIGKCCLIVSQVGISGSCKIGDGVVLAGQVGLADNIEIGDGVMVGAQAGVINNIQAGQKVVWTPAIERKEALRAVGYILKLPKLNEQFKQLSSRVEKLETPKDNSGPGNS